MVQDVANAIGLRPEFAVELRGFDRVQVLEQIRLLEDELAMVSHDRDVLVELNASLQRRCEDHRRALAELERRREQREHADSPLRAASERVETMLAAASEEAQTLRDHAQRQRESIRDAAAAQANQLIDEALDEVGALREQCAEVIAGIEARREQLRHEQAEHVQALEQRQQRMRHAIHAAYDKALTAAQQQANALREHTRRECAQATAETEQLRADALRDIHAEHKHIEALQQAAQAATRASHDEA